MLYCTGEAFVFCHCEWCTGGSGTLEMPAVSPGAGSSVLCSYALPPWPKPEAGLPSALVVFSPRPPPPEPTAVTGHTVPLAASIEEEESERREPPLLEPPAVEGAANGLDIMCYP